MGFNAGFKGLIHHCSTLTHHRAISLRRRHIDISSVSRRLHLWVIFGSVETQLYFSSSDKVQVFVLSKGFFNGISSPSSFPAQRSGIKKGPQNPSARGSTHIQNTKICWGLFRAALCYFWQSSLFWIPVMKIWLLIANHLRQVQMIELRGLQTGFLRHWFGVYLKLFWISRFLYQWNSFLP